MDSKTAPADKRETASGALICVNLIDPGRVGLAFPSRPNRLKTPLNLQQSDGIVNRTGLFTRSVELKGAGLASPL
jgi:hypothetical protein